MQLLTVTNQSTKATDADVLQWAKLVNFQLSHDRQHPRFNSSGWVKRRLAPPGQLGFIAKGATPPADAWNFIVLDNADQSGALGWHDDQAGKPYGEVFVVDSENDGMEVSAVLSHEVLETLCDPFVDPMQPQMVQRPGTDEFYIREVGDPVQGGDYVVTLPDGSSGKVSSFALPSWWEIEGSTWRPTSNTGDVKDPWEVDPKGYMSIFKNGNWTQIYGPQARRGGDPDDPGAARGARSDASVAIPRWDSRFHRVHTGILQRGVEAFKPRLQGR